MNVRKLVSVAVATIGLTLGMGAVAPQPAVAATPYVGCFVDSPAYDEYTPEWCEASEPAYSYNVAFQVFDAPAGSSFRWDMGGWTPAYTWGGNCTTSSSCTVKNVRPPIYRTMSVSVNGARLSAQVSIEPVCEWDGWLVFC